MKNKSINRRQFLKKATVAAAGAAVFPYVVSSSALGKAGSVAASERITLGFIGTGGQGMNNMHGFLRNRQAQVVAVCDVNKESDDYFLWKGPAGLEPARRDAEKHYAEYSRGGQYKGCAAYHDFRNVLADEKIDAVVICTPDHWHGLIAIEAAKAGKDIYCEKPLANTMTEGRAVCDAVQRYGVILQTGSHERSNESVRFACELVRNGRIGKLQTIRVNMPNSDGHHDVIRKNSGPQPNMPVPEGLDYDFWLGPAKWQPYTAMRLPTWWRFIMDYGGGEMTDRGAHIIDIGQLANGTDDTGPVEIAGRGSMFGGGKGIFDTFIEYDFECRYANGVRLIGGSTGQRGLRLEGTEGWIFIHIHGGRLEAEPKSLLQEVIGPDEIHLGRTGGHHKNFIGAVKTRGEPFAPAEVGHRTGSICHLVNIAMVTGRKIKWDPVREQIIGNADANSMLSGPMRSPWRL